MDDKKLKPVEEVGKAMKTIGQIIMLLVGAAFIIGLLVMCWPR